jgi:hypothetical protein
MLQTVPLQSWIILTLSFIAFLGPGFAIMSIWESSQARGLYNILVAFCLSLSLLAVSLTWTKLIGFIISSTTFWLFCLVGWFIAIILFCWKKKRGNQGIKYISFRILNKTDTFILASVGLYLAIQFWVLRDQFAGLGSDSYHHTLIANMIYQGGQLPSGYEPYAPIITFRYHFGFHAFIAALGWLSGFSIRLLVLISGPFLVVFSAIATGLLVNSFTKNRVYELFSINIVLFLSVFPGAMLNWGRYPQLLGYTIMLVLFSFVFYWTRKGTLLVFTPIIALLATGLALTHYRVTIMAAIGSFLLIALLLVTQQTELSSRRFISWAISIILCAIYSAPWLRNLLISGARGVNISYALSLDPSFFSITRLGEPVLKYITNIPLLMLAAIGSLYGILKKEFLILWQTIWLLCMLVVAKLNISGSYFDPVTVYMTIFIPIAIMSGWLILRILKALETRSIQYSIVILVFLIGFIIGIVKSETIIQASTAAFVSSCDVEAAQWISENIPPDAVFMINTYAFPFAPRYIIGIDGGYWLPLLANRMTVVPPMTYQNERFESAKMEKTMVRLHNLEGHLTSPKAIDELHGAHVTHVYVGGVGGIISVDELLKSSHFQLLYRNNGCYIFKVASNRP